MKSKTFFVFILLIFLFLITTPALVFAIRYVSPPPGGNNGNIGTGPDLPWATIQYAVDNADEGDTIIIMDGTFNENVEITQSVIIRSMDWRDNKENDDAEVVASDPADNVFTISSSNVVIEGLSIYGATAYEKAGIFISGETNCTIANNVSGLSSGETNHFGIYLDEFSAKNLISNNTINYNYTGIEAYGSTENTFCNNNLIDNDRNGIRLGNSSNNNIISGNSISGSDNANIIVYLSDNNTIIYNTLGTGGADIWLNNSDDNQSFLNNIDASYTPIHSTSGHSNYWSSPIELNYYYNGKWRKWYVGNYYSDHDLTDSNGDGITDTDYEITDDEPDDEYPMAADLSNYKVLEYGLVAYYPFNGNAEDESPPYDHNGTVIVAELTTDRFNKTNRAWFFDGDNDYIQVPNNSVLNMSCAQTLSAWIKPVSLSGRIISKRSGFSGFEFLLSSGNLNYTFNGFIKATTDLSGMEDQWIFVTGTYDGLNAKLYVNGVEEISSGETEAIIPNFSNMRFGLISSSSGFDFTGTIDEVRIYDRALSQEEITKLYNEGKTKINAGLLMLLLN